ncbi:MAG: helix-turn-helix domain-containing protein [Micrococcus sp.]|nr:helix-turn-helix domain-containing protein [Micrococcus sp.]
MAPAAATPSPHPWSALPPELPAVLAPVVPALAARLIEAVPQHVPAYAAATEGRYWTALARGVNTALSRLVALPGTDEPALNPDSARLVAGLGAGEFREGRSMDALLAAYRVGARISFRELSAACIEAGLDLSVMVDLGESIWAYIDELSAVSAQAYAAEQMAQAGLRERRRVELVDALMGGEASRAEVHRLAAAAQWRVPPRVCAVVMAVEAAARARLQLGASGVVVEREAEAVAIVAGREGPQTRLLRMLAGTGAVVGPAVDWPDLPYSHQVAQVLASQRDSRVRQPVQAGDHLVEIILGSQPRTVAQLAETVLAPLQAVSEAKRAVYQDTLLAWLRHHGQRGPMAEDLRVHQQTVGYRVKRLRDLFGEQLADPESRFALELALRARTLVTGPDGP